MSQKKSANFSSRWGFILSAVGSAVGMANVWGFPAKMGSNGGGAFLVAYLFFVALSALEPEYSHPLLGGEMNGDVSSVFVFNISSFVESLNSVCYNSYLMETTVTLHGILRGTAWKSDIKPINFDSIPIRNSRSCCLRPLDVYDLCIIITLTKRHRHIMKAEPHCHIHSVQRIWYCLRTRIHF